MRISKNVYLTLFIALANNLVLCDTRQHEKGRDSKINFFGLCKMDLPLKKVITPKEDAKSNNDTSKVQFKNEEVWVVAYLNSQSINVEFHRGDKRDLSVSCKSLRAMFLKKSTDNDSEEKKNVDPYNVLKGEKIASFTNGDQWRTDRSGFKYVSKNGIMPGLRPLNSRKDVFWFSLRYLDCTNWKDQLLLPEVDLTKNSEMEYKETALKNLKAEITGIAKWAKTPNEWDILPTAEISLSFTIEGFGKKFYKGGILLKKSEIPDLEQIIEKKWFEKVKTNTLPTLERSTEEAERRDPQTRTNTDRRMEGLKSNPHTT